MTLNIEIFRVINNLGKQYVFLNPSVVVTAEYTIYLLALSMLVYWFTRTAANRMMVIQAGLAFVFAELTGKVLGLLHAHQQPFAELKDVNRLIEHGINNSFPSDHTILFFSVCMSYWLVRRKWGWLWLALACCVAISRIWVGVHYPVDIAVGSLVGITGALVSYWLVPKLSFIAVFLKRYEQAEQRIWPTKG
ncbi:undecaprenyl-diphosphatase [Paenibacillus sp. UMB4589-SE434]|uniref:undecaprenyl-diphosphatase n=1 Tax=Paenibacillus sp. UMB4589-SE434 TaxID=3046314 RepID=UPI00254EFFDE|nr:undecaprenyl-diphosphatase [Paenibacillus sp. UMB4589-SE434]MDK8182843.1 undecaprenyl-diphosphatase [Paenibacillus sp. UMB4589-SE434]